MNIIEKGKIIHLKNLVDYAPNGIVSIRIIDKNAGNITLFAFDNEQKLSEHTAPYDAFVSIIEGKAEIIINGNVLNMSEGESVIMPADIPHAVRAPGRFKMLLVMIRA